MEERLTFQLILILNSSCLEKVLLCRNVENQIIKQKQLVSNYSIESYFTIFHTAAFSLQVSIKMMKNQLFKLENNQSTKQVLITMKKNKLLKQGNNQNTKQLSITMQDSRIVDCNLNKNKLTLSNLASTQSTNYRTSFFRLHSSEAYSEYLIYTTTF